MKHSIHSAITPSPAFDCDFVRAAQLRVAEMHASTAHPVEPPNLLELEQALGERVQKCELWAQNWRNRVYRIGLASGRAALAKQAVRGTEAMVQYQYNQLELLSKLDIPGMRVPKALAFLRPKRVYVMEFAPGETIESLLWNRSGGPTCCWPASLREKFSRKCIFFARRRSRRCRSNHWRAIWLRLPGIFHHANKRFCNWPLKPLLEPNCA